MILATVSRPGNRHFHFSGCQVGPAHWLALLHSTGSSDDSHHPPIATHSGLSSIICCLHCFPNHTGLHIPSCQQYCDASEPHFKKLQHHLAARLLHVIVFAPAATHCACCVCNTDKSILKIQTSTLAYRYSPSMAITTTQRAKTTCQQ